MAHVQSAIEMKGDARRLLAAGQPEDAIATLQEVLKIDEDDAEAHGWLGAGLSMTGNYVESIRHLKKAAILEPHEASYPFNAGCAYDRLGNREKAIAAYARALQLDGGYEQASQALQRLTGSLEIPKGSTWPDDGAASISRPQNEGAASDLPAVRPALVRPRAQRHTGWGSMGQTAYGSVRPEEEPGVVRTARSLFIFTSLVYLAAAGFCLMAWVAPEITNSHRTSAESVLLVIGLIVLPLSIALAGRCAWVVQHLPVGGPAIWKAVFNLAIIGCILLFPPIGIILHLPLIISWLRPETKAWFGVN